MLVPFDQLPGSARVWIYQSSRTLLPDEQKEMTSEIEKFLNTWTAHQASLKAGFSIRYDRFVIIGVDENYNSASGCSIDKQVEFIKQEGKVRNIDFFNRMDVARMVNGELETGNLHEFIAAIKTGKLNGDVRVFNNLVATMDELRSSWLKPLNDSWIMSMASY